jgi:mitochondrial protein import protein ZIM17
MYLFRPLSRRLVSPYNVSRALRSPPIRRFKYPQPTRLYTTKLTPDGLRNNRDLPSEATLTSRDATLLSQLPRAPDGREEVPSYAMVFTCKACSERSAHRISKQGYHHGTVLITCPGCKKQHLMADHLKIFSDKGVTVEDLLRERGDVARKAVVNETGDLEF